MKSLFIKAGLAGSLAQQNKNKKADSLVRNSFLLMSGFFSFGLFLLGRK
ncbi:hypothetical protein SAMN04488137_0718 [Fictibacillus solisalsi]|uniref:Uncharacterized protein n=1 Tax=Fictibacillus solisalsi TaxID=459525 RepID=A0A1G9U5X1_9BACL|nr:hypothetical protein SAMN04488137_0718 [Fictibacillus solisalsi]